MELLTREILCKRRWSHVGNLVKLWESPDDYVLPFFRSEEEWDFMTLVRPFLDTVATDEDPTPIDVRQYFPPLTSMTRYCMAHLWFIDDDIEHRFRCRHYDGGTHDAAVEIHVC